MPKKVETKNRKTFINVVKNFSVQRCVDELDILLFTHKITPFKSYLNPPDIDAGKVQKLYAAEGFSLFFGN